jgi:hypothetical protein
MGVHTVGSGRIKLQESDISYKLTRYWGLANLSAAAAARIDGFLQLAPTIN